MPDNFQLKNLLDAKMVAHILGGAWATIAELEGNSAKTTLNYFFEYLETLSKEDQNKNKLTPLITNCIKIANLIFDQKFLPSSKTALSDQNSLMKKNIAEIAKLISESVNNLQNSDDLILIPGGWSGLPAMGDKPKTVGHGMYYFIKKDDINPGKYIFGAVNAGSGSSIYHAHTDSQSITTINKNLVSPTLEWNNLTKEQVVNQNMLQLLIEPQILPLIHANNPDERPSYNEGYIYSILYQYLFTENNLTLQPGQSYNADIIDFVTPQRIGNCSWKSLMLAIRKYLGKREYKKFINNLKLNSMTLLIKKLEDDSDDSYREHRFLMIKALNYSAQKMAKTLGKRKDIFTEEELKSKLEIIDFTLQKSTSLKKKYLEDNPGKLVEGNLPNQLQNLTINEVPDRAEQVKSTILKQIASLNYCTTKALKMLDEDDYQVTIPKSYDNQTTNIDILISNLSTCVSYAKTITNSQELRSYLTNNVFNCLPIPIGNNNFWETFNVTSDEDVEKIFQCLNLLRDLTVEYLTNTVECTPLPEHLYSFVTIFGIGILLTKKYANFLKSQENSNIPEDLIEDDTFALPENFTSIFNELKGFDRAPSVEWEKLQSIFKFREIMYQNNNNSSAVLNFQQLQEFPEFKLYYKLMPSLKEEPIKNVITNFLIMVHHKGENPYYINSLDISTLLDYNLFTLIQLMQDLSILSLHLSYDEKQKITPKKHIQEFKFSGDLDDDESVLVLNYHELNYPELYNYTDLKPNKLLLNEPYLSALKINQQIKNNKQQELKSQNDLALTYLNNDEAYRINLIVNAPMHDDNCQQLTLLLDYFESLTEAQQNNIDLLEFFKQICLINIDKTMQQLNNNPFLAKRLISFFYKEFTHKKFQLERYLCFQRINFKIYSYLHLQPQATDYQKNICVDLKQALEKSREKLLNIFNNADEESKLDRSQLVAYCLASYNINELTDKDLEIAIKFSTYLEIYGFGLNQANYDLLLKKDIYDVRLKIAKAIISSDNTKKYTLLNLFGKAANALQHTDTLTWHANKDNPHRYHARDNSGNLLQIDLLSHAVFINDNQIINNNIPSEISSKHSSYLGQIFDCNNLPTVIINNNIYTLTKSSLANFKIKINGDKKPFILWDKSTDGSEEFVLLSKDDECIKKLNLPTSITTGRFNFWAKVTQNNEKMEILVAPQIHNKEPQPWFKILSDGKIIKNDDSNLALCNIQNLDETVLKNISSNLGCSLNNILVWKNNDSPSKIIKIEIPIVDNDGNWLSFELKSIDKDPCEKWRWNKDPNYYLSLDQSIKGRPSLSNFVLIENKEKNQKALFANLSEKSRSTLNDKHAPLDKLDKIYYLSGNKPSLKYIEICVNQTENLTQAELINSSEVGNLANLYIVYLNLVQQENDPIDASILLNKQRPLRRYSLEELNMLFLIIHSQKEQKTLNREQLNPDSMVTRLLALYLVKNNLEKYPFSKEELKQRDIQNVLQEYQLDTYTKDNEDLCYGLFLLTNEFYKKFLQLPKASGRSKKFFEYISNKNLPRENVEACKFTVLKKDTSGIKTTTYLEDQENGYLSWLKTTNARNISSVHRTIYYEDKTKCEQSLTINSSSNSSKKEDLTPHIKLNYSSINSRPTLSAEETITDKLIEELEQTLVFEEKNILGQLNTYLKKLKPYEILSGHKYELTIQDLILLYLKQNESLWKKLTLINDEQEIENIKKSIINYLSLKIKINALKQNINPLNQRQYDHIKFPAFLVYEAMANIILRQEQVDVFTKLLDENGLQTEQQLELMMGMGKSKVISPLLSHIKADGKHLSVLVLTDPLYNSGSQDLQKSLILLETFTETIEYSRNSSSLETLEKLHSQINNAIEQGIVCVARVKDLQTIGTMPEVLLDQVLELQKIIKNKISEKEEKSKLHFALNHKSILELSTEIQSLKDKQRELLGELRTEIQSLKNKQRELLGELKILLNINKILKEKGLFTLDELDTQLYSRHQLNLPIGIKKPISTVGINATIDLFSILLEDDFYINDEQTKTIKNLLLNNQQTLITQEEFQKIIMPQLAEKIFNSLSKELKHLSSLTPLQDITEIYPDFTKENFYAYVKLESTSNENAKKFYDFLKNKLDDRYDDFVNKIAIYRMQLADGPLQEALSKAANVQFGRSKLQPALEIVIPFAANNQPKETSVTSCALFKDPWETINKTCIYYMSSPWKDLDQTKRFVKFLVDKFSQSEWSIHLERLFGTEIYNLLIDDSEKEVLKEQANIEKINNKIEALRTQGNTMLLKLIFNYLGELIFSTQISFYPLQANSTPYDFAEMPLRLNGYSGTRFDEKTWHARLIRDEKKNLDKKIEETLVNNDDNKCIIDVDYSGQISLLLKNLSNKEGINLKQYSSFIDAGALFKGVENEEIAKQLLENLPKEKTAVTFYYEKKPGEISLALITRDILKNNLRPIMLKGSSPEQIASALRCSVEELNDNLFNFYDQAHIIGSDLPNPPKGRALMSFSELLVQDLMNQGVMRMRKFQDLDPNKRQFVDFLVPPETKNTVLKRLNKTEEILTIKLLIDHSKLIQQEQEKQNYYTSLIQQLNYEIKQYFLTTFRTLFDQKYLDDFFDQKYLDDFEDLYTHIKDFVLSIDNMRLFRKYGSPTEQTSPDAVLTKTVDDLKNRLDKILKNILDDQIFKRLIKHKENCDYSVIFSDGVNRLKTKLDDIIKSIDKELLPEKVSTTNFLLSNQEMELSTEQEVQQELQMQQEQNTVQKLTAFTPKLVLGIPPEDSTSLNYLKTVKFDNTCLLFDTILSNKLKQDVDKNQEDTWNAYKNIIKNLSIYYSQDALKVFDEINPIDGLFTEYEKPITQVLIVEDEKKLQLIVLSAQESVNFASCISQARNDDSLQSEQSRKIWLVSPNGHISDGITSESAANLFDLENDHNSELSQASQLLLIALILQKDTKHLGQLIDNKSNIRIWFNNNLEDIKNIFNLTQYDYLRKKIQNYSPLLLSDCFKQSLSNIARIDDDNSHKYNLKCMPIC